jgi:PBSX family phage terminase large subunit
MEEAQKISKRSWEVLNPTIRKENSQIFLSMNPEVPHSKHPIMSELLTIFKDETLHIHANYTDNPFCTDDIINIAEQLQKHKPDDYNYIWLGVPPDQAQNTIVKHFTSDNIKECNHIDTLNLHLSCDFNVDPMMWVVAHKTEDKVFFIDEIVIENTSTREAIQEFISRYGNHQGSIIVNGDASGDYRSCQSERSNYIIIKNELEKHFKKHIKIDIKKHNPPIIERIQAFNNMVLSDTGQRNIIISPKCKHLIYNLENLRFKPGTSQIDAPTFQQIKQDKEAKFLGHIFDAASYLIDFYYPIRKKNYADYRN